MTEPAVNPYDRAFDPDSSYGSAVRLVQRSRAAEGVVIDLGCGFGPVAEPLRDAGLEYVGVDVDTAGLADLEGRGFEVHAVDLELATDELEAELSELLGARRLACVLALDALEHLRHPAACVDAVTALAKTHPGAQLVLSLPNVTHVEVAAKLLLGRWEVTATGLLDATHLQYFDERRAVSLATDAGWTPVDDDDVVMRVTEQCDPPDAPQLRPGAPLNELLRVLRRRADGHGETYQFVRRYELSDGHAPSSAAPTPGSRAALAAVVVGTPDPELLADLAAQHDRDLQLFVTRDADVAAVAAAAELSADDVHVVDATPGLEPALAASGARYVVQLWPGTRLDPEWSASLRAAADHAPGRVLVAGCRSPSSAAAIPGAPPPRTRVDLATFELLGPYATGAVVPAAYAVPVAALVDAGAGRLGTTIDELSATIARCVLWCGRHDVPAVTVAAPVVGELADLAPAIIAELDREPVAHGAGGLGPAQAAARTAADVGELHALVATMQAHHKAFAEARDVELARLHAQVAATSTPWGAARFAAQRIKGAVARRLARLTRRARGPR